MKKIVVNSDDGEVRAAILQDGVLMDLFIERTLHPRYAGNIYKGKVENVLPGMQAAFVDVGLERNVFLYVDDALGGKDSVDKGRNPDDIRVGDEDEIRLPKSNKSIKDILKVGQEIIVQVTKDPIGTKGARVVMDITLPGRYVVLMPTVDYIGISRKIEDESERERLKKIAQTSKPKKMGVIVRTAAEGKSDKEIAADIQFLSKLWRKVQARGRRLKAPAMLHQDYDLIYRLIRDQICDEVEEFVVDKADVYKKTVDLMSMTSSNLCDRVKIYKGQEPIFDRYGLEDEIIKALKRKVWLKCGGYLIIDHTEALTVIDVNTGKFIGSTCLADTVLQTNLEAAAEIARQVRLRNIGGIIIIDFIDMEDESHRKMVVKQLEESLQGDKTKATVLGFTQLGLVEMTRKKVQQGLADTMTKTCPECEGRGKIVSEETLAYRAMREIKKQAGQTDEPAMLVHLNPTVAAVLIGFGGSNLANIEESTGKMLYVKGNAALGMYDVVVAAVGSREYVESKALPVAEGDIVNLLIEEHHITNQRNGICRIEGYVIDVAGAARFVGYTVDVEIVKVFKTYAKAKLVNGGASAKKHNFCDDANMGTLNIIRTVLPDVSEKAHNDEFLEEMGDVKSQSKATGSASTASSKPKKSRKSKDQVPNENANDSTTTNHVNYEDAVQKASTLPLQAGKKNGPRRSKRGKSGQDIQDVAEGSNKENTLPSTQKQQASDEQKKDQQQSSSGTKSSRRRSRSKRNKKTAKSAATVKNKQETLADDRTVEKADIDVAISSKTKTKRTRRRRSRRPVNRENVNDKSTDGDISEVVKSEG